MVIAFRIVSEIGGSNVFCKNSSILQSGLRIFTCQGKTNTSNKNAVGSFLSTAHLTITKFQDTENSQSEEGHNKRDFFSGLVWFEF